MVLSDVEDAWTLIWYGGVGICFCVSYEVGSCEKFEAEMLVKN